jgi:hemoglobin/transferrin/lactoferrin receptor protein
MGLGVAAGLSGAATAQEAGRQGPPPQAAERLDDITVTATRQPRQRLNVPQTITVIRRSELDERVTPDIRDLVRNEPGVSVNQQTTGTDPFKNFGGFTIRGVSGNRVQTLIDGARTIERITDRTRDVFELPFVAAVEIARGPGSVLWGADALGGIVSFRTLDPSDILKGRQFGARLSGSFDTLNDGFSKTAIAAVQVLPTVQVLAGINHRSFHEPTFGKARADGGRYPCPTNLVNSANFRFLPCNKVDPQDGFSFNAIGKLVFTPTADHEFKLTGEYFGRTTEVDQLYNFGALSGVGATQVRNGPFEREQELSRYRATYDHRWSVGLGFLDEIKTKFSHSPQTIDLTGRQLQTRTTGATAGQVIETIPDLRYRETFTQGDIQLTSRFDLGWSRHTLTYGWQGDETKTDYSRQERVTNLRTGVTTTTRGGGFNFANATTRRSDVYLQDEIDVLDGRLTVTPGLRFATYRITPRPDADYRVVPGKPPRERESVRLVPQVGAVFRFDQSYSVYARYAEGFKMPTAEQLYTSLPSFGFNLIPNPDLRPEKARTVEAGVRGQFDWGWVSLGAFHTRYSQFIAAFQPVPGTIDITYKNLGRVTLQGIEASGEYRVMPDVTLTGSLTYQYGTQQETPLSPVLAYDGASPFRATAGLRYAIPAANLEASIIGNFAGDVTRASSPNLYKPGGYAVADAFLTWRPAKQFTLRAGVLNIFDRRYFASLAGGTTYNKTAAANVAQVNPIELQTAPGRTFRFSAQVDF